MNNYISKGVYICTKNITKLAKIPALRAGLCCALGDGGGGG